MELKNEKLVKNYIGLIIFYSTLILSCNRSHYKTEEVKDLKIIVTDTSNYLNSQINLQKHTTSEYDLIYIGNELDSIIANHKLTNFIHLLTPIFETDKKIPLDSFYKEQIGRAHV